MTVRAPVCKAKGLVHVLSCKTRGTAHLILARTVSLPDKIIAVFIDVDSTYCTRDAYAVNCLETRILQTVAERTYSGKILRTSLSKRITCLYGLRPMYCSWHYSKMFSLETFLRLPKLHQSVHFTVLPPKLSAVLLAKTVSPFRTMLLLLSTKIAPVNQEVAWDEAIPGKLYTFPLRNDPCPENTRQHGGVLYVPSKAGRLFR